ncbi:MAG: hypothetical protein VB058_05800 [Oscillospiraceae bacterium]|nr:hypothetical protein [Oscillospiraceae bacterium]
MRFRFNLLPIDLRLFDGEGAGVAAGAEGAQAGNTGTQTVGQSATDTTTGDLSAIKFGKQAAEGGKPSKDGGSPDAGGSTQQAPADPSTEFKALIGKDGKYKDAFQKEFQAVFDRRFKDVKGNQERLTKLQPLVDSLASKYGIEDGDPDKLTKALDQDETFWQAAAEKAGFDDVKIYRDFVRLQSENAHFAQAEADRQAAQQAEDQVKTWAKDIQTMLASGKYQFDPTAEMDNPQMISLLKANVPFETAYKTIHLDDITESAAQSAAKDAEKRLTDNIRAKGSMPKENGAAGSAGVSFNPADPATWDKDHIMEVFRQVEAGKVIKL